MRCLITAGATGPQGDTGATGATGQASTVHGLPTITSKTTESLSTESPPTESPCQGLRGNVRATTLIMAIIYRLRIINTL